MQAVTYVVMSAIPLLALVAVTACAIKLSVLLLRYQLRWPYAFAFAVLMAFLSFAGRNIAVAHGTALGIILGLLLQTILGAWFFSGRAKLKTGEQIGWMKSVALTAVAQVMLIVVGLALIYGVRIANR